jgi:hypothetical protein
MNLLDYQKSGNAFGTNVVEYPKFSVLKDKIPKIPGITSLPYVGGYIFQPDFQHYESFYGSRIQIVAANGFVFFKPSPSLVEKKYTLSVNFANTLKSYDPIRQSIGSVPFQYPGKNYQLLRNSGDTLQFQGGFNVAQHASTVETYNKATLYDLPFNYIQGSQIKNIRFGGLLESPFNGEAFDSSQTGIIVNGTNIEDQIGKEKYKVFNIKKEQYVHIYLSVPPVKDDFFYYKQAIDKVRLNLMSLFFPIPNKANDYSYSVKDLSFYNEQTFAPYNNLVFNNSRSPFDYDRSIERVSAPTQADQNYSFYEEGLIGKDLEQKSKEISHLAFQRFKEIEGELYKDYSFDVESSVSVVQYEVQQLFNGGTGIPPIKETFVNVGVPSGIPVNVEAIDSSVGNDKNYLSADIYSNYNYLNTTFENAFDDLPEIAIPNVYSFVLSEDIGKSIEDAYTKLSSAVINCAPYQDFIQIGKNKKIIFFGSDKFLTDQDLIKTNSLLPMSNIIEFDIYSNANREINKILQSSGVHKDFLYSLLTLIYGPKAEYEITSDLSKNSSVATPTDVATAHSRISDSLLALDEYFIFNPKLKETRITSIKQGTYTPSFLDTAIVMDGDGISFDFERWYRYYMDFFEWGYQWEEDPWEGKPLIDKSRFKEYFSDFSLTNDPKAPSDMEEFPLSTGYAIEDMKAIFADKMRDLNQIMSKEPSYSEPIMYKIEKFDIEGNSIQTIFIPHIPEEDFSVKQILAGEQPELVPKIKKLRYIDSQVKYGKLYRYKVSQIRIVVASEYRYKFVTNRQTDKRAYYLGYTQKYEVDTIMSPTRLAYNEGEMLFDSVNPPSTAGENPENEVISPFVLYSQESYFNQNEDKGSKFIQGSISLETEEGYPNKPIYFNKMAIFKSILYPTIRIEEVPYYEEEVIISDFPPIPPNVNFDPLIGKGSKILLTFENQTGDREEVPIEIEPMDSGLFNLQRTAQKRNEKNADGSYVIPSLRFKSDDFPKAYEIFRVDTPPMGYNDFSGNLYRYLHVEEATAIVESLEPNKTYYYMFRTIDIHGNVSNPSAVFAVQMTFDSGVYYPVVNTYEFSKTKIGTKHKQFKQYLKIEAALIQKLLNKEKSGITDASSNVDTPVLGVVDQSLWNQKKFKFRITSKHTGKMIDLNVKFKTNHTDPIDPIKGC